jgi:hypothetical protein
MGLLDGSAEYEPLDKYLPHTATATDSLSLGEKVVHGSVAVLADVGTTYWNSLLPEKYEASTADLLSRIDNDALQVYNENTDTIRTLSFVAGMVAPIGLSIKGMGMLRAGTKGMSWFSEAGQAANLAKVESEFAKAGRSAEFFAARWQMYRGVAMNAVADNVAAEVAIVGTLSAHPFMEDYYKDFGTNFVKSVAFGSVLQTGIGSIIAKGQMAAKTSPIEEAGNRLIKETIIDPQQAAKLSERSHLGDSLQIRIHNVDRLDEMIAKIDDPADPFTVQPFTKTILQDAALRERATITGMLKDAAQGDFKAFLDTAPKEVTDYFLRFAGSVEAAGLDKIGFAEVKGATKRLGEGIAEIQQKEKVSLFQKVFGGMKKPAVEDKFVREDAIFLPTKQTFISKTDFPYYSTLADLGKTVESLEKNIDKRLGVVPLSDWSVESIGRATALVEQDYAEALLWASKLDVAKFNKVVADPDHLPILKALYMRGAELLKEDPTAVLSVKLTKEAPSFGALQAQALSVRGGVAPTYVSDLAELSKRWDEFSLYHPNKSWDPKLGLSRTAHDALHNWVHGSYAGFRMGAALNRNLITDTSAIQPEALARMREFGGMLNDIYNLPASQALRTEFRRMADADGNVWLYRGMSRDPKGHQAIESYTTLPDKAAEFGRGAANAVKLYKVNVDDIVGTVHDFGNGYKPEILAYPPTRDYFQISKSNLRELPDELVIKAPEVVTVADNKTAVVSGLSEIEREMNKAQLSAVMDMKQRGFGVETIALKTGTPEDTINRIIETGRVEGAGLIKFGSKEDIIAAIDPTKRALALSTDMNKVSQPGVYAKLNSMKLDDTSAGILEMNLMTSTSPFVRSVGEAVLSEDMKILTKEFYNGVADFTTSKLKSTAFTSTNQALEAFGPVGQVANMIGKEVIRIKNELKEAFEKPISNLMGQIIKQGEATLIEANTAFNVAASIKGRKFYRDGSFWIPSEKLGLGELRQLVNMSDDIFKGAIEADPTLATKATFAGKEYNVATESVRQLLTEIQKYGREMYEFKNAKYKALGRQELSDIGFWSPSFNPRDKSIAYVYNRLEDTTTMLYAESDELLTSGIAAYKSSLLKTHGANWEQRFEVVTKANQEHYNMLAGRHDSLYMQAADLTKQHGGSSASAVVSTDTSVFRDLLQGYQDHVNKGVEDLVEIQLNQSMNMLKNLSDLSTGVYTDATKGVLGKLKSKPVDLGNTLRNILIGRPQITEHKAWSELQQRGQVFTDMALKTISEAFQPILDPIVGKISGTKARSAEEWTKVVTDMESKGIVNPFAPLDKAFGLERYMREGAGDDLAMTPRAIALGNGVAATVLLRFLELGQPLVNALSLPILTSGAMNRKLAGSFMGATLDEGAKFSLAATMYDGVRAIHAPHLKQYFLQGEKKGYFAVELRNVTELMEHQRSLDSGVMTAAEKGLESSFVKMLSKPSDLSEEMVRRTAFGTGVVMAKRAYPGLSDTGVMTFARNFMDEAIGNYTAAQRPAMFQGTFGMAMGLFQTYMLTLAQQMYRQVEHKDWASLGKLLLTQSTIFGVNSLPGFHQVSEMIGKNFSDQNVDLESGTFRAVSDPVASMILYGLPSSFGPGITTRGDIQPRIPNPVQGLDSLALYNLTKQAYTGAERVASAAWNADESAGKAMLEALSLQSISRPIARLSELASGQSITSRGDIVAKGTEIYNTQGIISRLMATRPIEEIKAREVLHLNSVYGAANSDKRKAVTSRLKSHIRNGDLDGDTLDVLAEEYLRTGSSNGWRAAVNDAVKQAGQDGNATTMSKLKAGSPLNMMIEDLD